MVTKYAPRTQTAAITRAKSFDGKRYPRGRCQAFVVVEVFGTGAVGDYDGDRAADAEDGWKKAKDRGHVVPIPAGLSTAERSAWIKKIPGGYMAYYTGGSADNGHAATTLGGGKLFTTDKTYASSTQGVCGVVDVTWPETHWGLKFVGYATIEGNGFTLTDRPGAAAEPPVAVWSKPETFVLGSTGADVTRLGERLVVHAKALGLPAPYKSGPGPTFTVTDEAAVRAFQEAQGWTGDDADGLPGAETLNRLAAEPADTFRVMLWNTKAPELTLIGIHKWISRRLGIVARIKAVEPTILGMIESGSGTNLTWYKTALKLLGLTWVQGGAKWQNTWVSKAATIVTGGLFKLPTASLLNGDQKEMDCSVVKIGEYEWYIGVGHPENENGRDRVTGKTGEQLRQLQVAGYLTQIDARAASRGIPERRRLLLIDGNSPTGGVKRWVTGHTHYRDVFDLAAATTGKGLRSNNKWAQSLAAIAGVQERIDLILIGGNDPTDEPKPQIKQATNHDAHTLSDHNDQYADIFNI